MSTLLKIRKQHPSMMMVILTNNNEYSDVYQLITTKPGERKKQE
jgi:DNA-binding NarL/FixJ family response regulator